MNTLPKSSTPAQPHQRRIKYIDQALQKWFLIALVTLEILILVGAGAILYFRLDAAVEDSLYRVHLAGQPSMLSVLLKESLQIVVGLIAINLIALFVADRIWARRVRGILGALRKILHSVRDLDLREETVTEILPSHEVLIAGLEWHRTERKRHLALRKSIAALEHMAKQSDTSDDAFRAGLLAFCHELPSAEMQDPCPPK
jgi:hypothetical protein